MPTLSEKVWERHVVHRAAGEPDLLYIDLHLVHEVTSPQAFDGLRLAGRKVRRPDLTLATMDHNVPTQNIDQPVADLVSARQMEALARNCAEFGIRLYPMGDPGQGIVWIAFAALIAGKELAGFGSGEKHQEQKAEPVNKAQSVSLMAGGFGQS